MKTFNYFKIETYQKIFITLFACLFFSQNILAQPTADVTMLNLEQESVDFTRLLNEKDIALSPPTINISSKSYYQEVSGDELNKGVNVFTDGDEAIFRLTPIKNPYLKQTTIPQMDISAISVLGSNGSLTLNHDTMSLKANAEQMNNAFPELFEDTVAFKMSKSMGNGFFSIRSHQSLKSNQKFMLHVFDKNSTTSLTAAIKNSNLLIGEPLNLKALSNNQNYQIKSARVNLISPTGIQILLPSKIINNNLLVDWPISNASSSQPGELWKVIVETQGDLQLPLKRIVELSVDINESTAKLALNNLKTNNNNNNNINNTIINVKKPGRYELRVWYYNHDKDGVTRPSLLYSKASWLEPGMQQVSLNPDFSLWKNNGKHSIRKILLLDQTRLAVLDKHLYSQ